MHDTSSSPPASLSGVTPAARRALPRRVGLRTARRSAALFAAAALAFVSVGAFAYTVALDAAAPQTIYLQIGVGSFTADYCGGTTYPPTHDTPNCGPNYGGGTPQNNTAVNSVSVTVASR